MKKGWICGIAAAVIAGAALSGCQNAADINVLQIKEKETEKTVLTLFMSVERKQNVGATIYRDIIADYNSRSENVEIRVDGLATGDGFNEALAYRLEQGGAGADLFIVNADNVKTFHEKGYFYDLSGLSSYQKLNAAAKQEATVGDTVYTIPTIMTAYGMYVNVGLLKEHGLVPPKNIEEFLNCCEVLKAAGITPISINRWYGMTTFTMSRGLYPIYQSEQKEEILAGLNDGSIKISEYMLEGFRFFEELVKKGYYGDNLTKEHVDSVKAGTSDWDDFVTGKTAFVVFPSGKEELMEQDAPEMEFIQQGFPTLPDDTISLPTISARLCVYSGGEHIEEALEALEFLTAHRTGEYAKAEGGFLTVVQDEKVAHIDERIQPLYDDAVSPGQIPIEDMSLCFDYWGTVRLLCLEIIDGMSPEEAAQEYDRIQMEAVAASMQ